MREYKIGDWVIYTDKEESDDWKEWEGFPLYGKLAKIIDIEDAYFYEIVYTLKFEKYKNEYDEFELDCYDSEFKSIDHLKFKKWVKG